MHSWLPLYNLVQRPDVAVAFILASTFFHVGYHSINHIFRHHITTSRQRAWILTFLSSSIMTLGSLPSLCTFIFHHHLSFSSPMESLLIDRYLCVFFVAYLITDLIIGRSSYPDQITLITGWIHHSAYTFLLIHLIHQGLTTPFCVMTILELPTFVLSLGHLNTSWRRDMWFGATFFLTRILYHAVMIHRFYWTFPYGGWWMVLVAAMPMHLHWFGGWIRQQHRKYKGKHPMKGQRGNKGDPLQGSWKAALVRPKRADVAKAD